MTSINPGFDWDNGTIFLEPESPLTLLTPEDVAAIHKSVSLGQSWHSYQDYKRAKEKNDARFQWLADEGATIKSLSTQEGVRYTVRWPNGEEMAEFFHTPKMALDNAMRLNDVKPTT